MVFFFSLSFFKLGIFRYDPTRANGTNCEGEEFFPQEYGFLNSDKDLAVEPHSLGLAMLVVVTFAFCFLFYFFKRKENYVRILFLYLFQKLMHHIYFARDFCTDTTNCLETPSL